MSTDSISQWLVQLQAGEAAAAQNLWERYYQRLVGLARVKLQGRPRRIADEEDVALSAFASFCRGVEEGRFPQLQERDNLWRLLVTITERKAIRQVRDQTRQKRGGGTVRGESVFLEGGTAVDQDTGLANFAGREPTPEFAAQIAEECSRLLDVLQDRELRAIAVLKMEGATNPEIAQRLGCAPSTVERRLRLIRQVWEHEGAV